MFNTTMHDMPRALQHLLEREAPTPTEPPRRTFLKLSAVSGFALGVFPLLSQAQGSAAAPAALKPSQRPGAFVAIAADGMVTVTVNRLEFGQGVQTALPMILAEELDADWSKVRSQLGTNDMAYADPMFGTHLTGGSNSIKNSFTQYRELGARTRAMLMSCRKGSKPSHTACWASNSPGMRQPAGSAAGGSGSTAGAVSGPDSDSRPGWGPGGSAGAQPLDIPSRPASSHRLRVALAMDAADADGGAGGTDDDGSADMADGEYGAATAVPWGSPECGGGGRLNVPCWRHPPPPDHEPRPPHWAQEARRQRHAPVVHRP